MDPLTCKASKCTFVHQMGNPFQQDDWNANTDCLPFNGSLISDDFVASPNCDPLHHTPGYWAILQGHGLIVVDEPCEPALPFGDLPDAFTAEHEPLCIGLWQGKPLRIFSIEGLNEIPLPCISNWILKTYGKID
jgi:hypothetical protein